MNCKQITCELDTMDSEWWNVWMWLIVDDYCSYLCLVFNYTRAREFLSVLYLWRNGWGLSEWKRRRTCTFWQIKVLHSFVLFYSVYLLEKSIRYIWWPRLSSVNCKCDFQNCHPPTDFLLNGQYECDVLCVLGAVFSYTFSQRVGKMVR